MVPETLDDALAEVRRLILDPERLVRAVAAGRRRGSAPTPVRAELRPVDLKAGRRLQVVSSDGVRPSTRNLDFAEAAAGDALDELLAEPFGNWHVETTETTLQLRVTKRGDAQVHRGAPATSGPDKAHDRAKEHLLATDDPLYEAIGGTAAKRRQVDAFLRALAATLDEDLPSPLRVVDLGCGNAYLTFAAYRYLAGRGLDVHVTGVDVREDQRVRNTALAERLGCADRVTFVAGTIADADVPAPDVVLALHACDTATDDALARAVRWEARWILAAPCCHHDIAAQLRRGHNRSPYSLVTQHGILRERFADVLTDTLRAALLRQHGYRVEVVEFVDSQHTPRNLLLRARRTGEASPAEPPPGDGSAAGAPVGYTEIIEEFGLRPRLAELLG
jgi:SAM-dependent methyltransferase